MNHAFLPLSSLPSRRLLERLRDISLERPTVIANCAAGVQSSTIAALMATGDVERADVAIFADTGWEPPEVYEQLDRLDDEILAPSGIPLIRTRGHGNIRANALRTDGGHCSSMPLHVLGPDGRKGIMRNRQCTRDYKVVPIERLIRAILGAPVGENGTIGRVPKERRAIQYIGFSYEEQRRVHDDIGPNAHTEFHYPLIEQHLTRQTCMRILEQHDLQDTKKSACVGCPFSGNARWREMRDTMPESWEDAIDFDERIRNGHPSAGTSLHGTAYLHRSCIPLAEAPIDIVTGREHKDRQEEVNLSDYEDDPPGCSPFGCRTTAINSAYAYEATA